MSAKSGFYVTSPEDDSVKRRGADGKLATVVQDKRLRWPDSMAEGPDGALYVTSSRIQDNSWFKPQSPISLKTELWRFAPPR
jgi:sugar lactone lactonase YvrE